MKRLRIYYALIAVVICGLAVGCAGADTSATKQKKSEFTVVTSFYPMYITTLNVVHGVENVVVKNMTKPQTGCLHDYRLLPEDMKLLEQADVFVVNGAGMESFLDKVLERKKELPILEASKDIVFIESDGERNPHVWTSISNVIVQTKNIAEQLAASDQKNADAYRKNAEVYITKLEKLLQEMHGVVDSLPNKNIITFHEAFPYFAQEFRLNIVDVIVREPGVEPSPKEVEASIAKVKSAQVKALFVEPQYPASAATVIAKESGVKVYTLDPIVTGEADGDYDAYINKMKSNVTVLQEALQ